MIHQLTALCSCGRPWAEQRAQMALMFYNQRQSGLLDESEYRELLEDLVSSDRLEAEADDLETKTLLVNCIYAASQVV